MLQKVRDRYLLQKVRDRFGAVKNGFKISILLVYYMYFETIKLVRMYKTD